MADQDYERDEQLLEARRLKRLELKRKRMIRKRITFGVLFLVIVLLIVVIFKACGKDSEPTGKDEPSSETDDSQVQAETPQSTKATLAAVGDIMVYDSQLQDALQEDGTYNFLPSLAPVASLLAESDVTVGNFEANFGTEPVGYPNFRAPEALATTLSGLGFDILQTANTYSIQNGLAGLQSTINTIRGAGMNSLGTYLSADDKTENQVVVKEVNGIRMAFIGFTKGVNNLTLPEGSEYAVDLLYTDYATTYDSVDTTAINTAVAAAKATDPDVIIAMVHWGSEYETAISSTQTEVANLLIQGGVDVIIGSHPHIVGPMEMQTVTVDGEEKNVFVAYSLGNFLAAMERDDQAGLNESVILNLEFTKTGDETTISNAGYIPVYFFDNGENAAARYEVRPIYDVLSNSPDDATKTLMEDALTKLDTNTGGNFDLGASAAVSNTGDADASAEPDTTTDAGGTE